MLAERACGTQSHSQSTYGKPGVTLQALIQTLGTWRMIDHWPASLHKLKKNPGSVMDTVPKIKMKNKLATSTASPYSLASPPPSECLSMLLQPSDVLFVTTVVSVLLPDNYTKLHN